MDHVIHFEPNQTTKFEIALIYRTLNLNCIGHFELDRTDEVERRVLALSIIKDLDIFEDFLARFIPDRKGSVIKRFGS